MGTCLTTTIPNSRDSSDSDTESKESHTSDQKNLFGNVKIYLFGKGQYGSCRYFQYQQNRSDTAYDTNALKRAYSFNGYPMYSNGHNCKKYCQHLGYCFINTTKWEIAPHTMQHYQHIEWFNEDSKWDASQKVRKICTRPTKPSTAFFITEKGEIYYTKKDTHNYPIWMSYFAEIENVTDIQRTSKYIIALCGGEDYRITEFIIEKWTDSMNSIIPKEILELIFTFQNATAIHMTRRNDCDGGDRGNWFEIKFFRQTFIKKMVSGKDCTLLLECNGIVWKISTTAKKISTKIKPVMVRFEANAPLRVEDIECGLFRALFIVGDDRKLYSYSMNKSKYPLMVKELREYSVDKIACGGQHFYCLTTDGKHYFWGSNKHNECPISGDEAEECKEPVCVNQMVKKETNGGVIKSVSLGKSYTLVFVEGGEAEKQTELKVVENRKSFRKDEAFH